MIKMSFLVSAAIAILMLLSAYGLLMVHGGCEHKWLLSSLCGVHP